ncbi:glycine d-alanine aminopeptidase [Microdochium trichocladiopsis]|uniref:Glycine d-alanine aminopeptidase n=1 Tax=Microdochium trichocladiopsis TaxID=1682393 RepID=A0A9P9BTH6_9PEZI|nr:glycine d-alanine aminopeptidase [Microdochium trichocladiopsis]KAH7029861.1 glycine d-alanine aminopeptidase [Microdochium trichocladiopsis]
MADSIDKILSAAADKFRGPGGCLAVVRDGQLVGQHVWGFAQLDEGIPFTAQTLVPICSITKHLLCGTVYMAAEEDPSLTDKMQALFDSWLGPALQARQQDPKTRLTIAHLCDNQSGVRDYWAATVLCGAKPEDDFDMANHAPRLRELLLQSLHFEPGTEYSYSNLNFYIVARLLEQVTGKTFADLVAQYIFKPAGMTTAALPPKDQPPPPCVGYEGDEKRGYVPAVNGIEWAGDAGIVASLDDMVAYEKHLQGLWAATATDGAGKKNWYQAAAEPHVFTDGKSTPAKYRMGLGHGKIQDKVVTLGHGGALRGFRLMRSHAPAERVSVIVLFNHEASSKEAADFVLQKVLGMEVENAEQAKGYVDEPPSPAWAGEFLDQDTGLRVNVELGEEGKGKVKITYVMLTETIKLTSSSTAESLGMKAKIEGDVLTVHRIVENRTLVAKRIKAAPALGTVGTTTTAAQIVGKYKSDELQSTLSITGSGAILYGIFEGFMGKGPVHLMKPLGENVWVLACPRGIDSAPPADWTLVFHSEGGKVKGMTIGCWLTRKVDYRKIE